MGASRPKNIAQGSTRKVEPFLLICETMYSKAQIERLWATAVEAKWMQWELAEHAGVSREAVRQWGIKFDLETRIGELGPPRRAESSNLKRQATRDKIRKMIDDREL